MIYESRQDTYVAAFVCTSSSGGGRATMNAPTRIDGRLDTNPVPAPRHDCQAEPCRKLILAFLQ
jgi:hypothetical protein